MNHKHIKIFIALLVALFIFPATVTDVLYRDDAYRLSISGGYWWWMGRPLADVTAWLTSNSTSAIINSHPLGLICSAAIFVFVIFFIIDKKLVVDEAYAVVPLPLIIISPFFIQNIAYQYDAPGMVLGLSFALLSYFILSLKSNYKHTLSFACIFVSLSLYQPTANIFLGLSAANLLIKLRNYDKGKFFNLVEECLVFAIAYILYYLFIIKLLSMSGAGRGNIIPISELYGSLVHTFNQLRGFISPLLNPFLKLQLALFTIIAAGWCVLSSVRCRVPLLTIAKQVAFVALSVAMMLFAIIGVSFIVPEGIAGVRVLVGFGSVYYLLCALTIKFLNQNKPIIVILIVSLPTFTYSYQFFKYSSEQRRFEYNVLNSIINETYGYNKVYITGNMKEAPPVKRAMAENKALTLLLSPAQPWVYKRLAYSLGATNVDQGWSDKPAEAGVIARDGRIVSDGRYYRVIQNVSDAVVEMK